MKTDHSNYMQVCYPDIYFDYIFQHGSEIFLRTNTEAVIFFVFSGELNIRSMQEDISVRKGQYAFVKHDVLATIYKNNCGADKFCCAFLGFSKRYLLDLYLAMGENTLTFPEKRFEQELIKIPYTPYMQSLYISLIPYLKYGVSPTKTVLELKRQEGIYSLVLTDERFYPCLFDFVNSIK